MMETLQQAQNKIDRKKILRQIPYKVFGYWHVYLVVLILGVIAFLNFRPGYSILTNDNYSPELNPDVTINRILYSPAWRSYRGLGVASDSEQSDLFRAVTYKILNTFVLEKDMAQVYMIMCFAIGSISFGVLATKIFKDHAYHKFVFLTASIIYISTLWTAWIFVFPMMPFVSMFAFLPLLLCGVFDFIENKNNINSLKLFFYGLLFSSTALVSTLFFVSLGVIVIFVLLFVIAKKFKSWIKLLALLIIPQLLWLIPFFSYITGSGGDVVDSSVNRAITESTIDVETQKMTAVNSVRFYTRLLDTFDATGSEEKMFKSADNYSTVEGYRVLSFMPMFFAIMGMVFFMRTKNWRYSLIVIGGVGFWFLLKNQNAPFGQIYTWLQDNVEFFRQVFRWPTSKFGQAFLIFLGLTSTFGIVSTASFFTSFVPEKLKKYFSVGFVIAIVLLNLVFVGYLFYGELSADRSYVQIPDEYFELSEYLSKEENDGRLLVLPVANNSYFREYDWGFIGSGFLWYMIPNSMQEKALSVGSSMNDFADYEIEKSYFSNDKVEFEKDLEKYDIEYILVDKNLVKGRYGYEIDFELADSMVSNFERVWSKGDLSLYKNDLLEPSDYFEISDSTSHDFLSQGFVSYIENNPTVYPIFESGAVIDFDDNYLSTSVMFSGEDSEYVDNIEKLDLQNLPIKMKIEDEVLVVQPSLPEIKDVPQELSEYRYEISKTSEYIVVGDYFINREKLSDWYAIDYMYRDVEEIFGVDGGILDSIEYSSILGKLPTQDCTGKSDGSSVDISILKNGNFEMEASDGIGCVYTDVELPGAKEYGATFSMDWHGDVGTQVGYCLWSKSLNACVNSQRFFYSDKIDMTIEYDMPILLSPEDEYSLTVYVISKEDEKSSAEFENIEISFFSKYDLLDKISEQDFSVNTTYSFKNEDTLVYKIPVIHSISTYLYSSNVSYVGEPLIETLDGEYSEFWADEEGSNMRTLGQNASYYNPSLNLGELGKNLMFYWYGNNTTGIPASLCLNYVDDDKCFVDDMLYTGTKAGNLKFFYADNTKKRLFLKMVSQSYANTSENSLDSVLLQELPVGWIDYKLTPSSEATRYVSQSSKVNRYSSLYVSNVDDVDDILVINESESNGWNAYILKDAQVVDWMPSQLREIFYSIFGTRIPSDMRVTVDGWKQGFDLSRIDKSGFSKVAIVYTPNVGSYVGLFVGVIMFSVLICLSIKDLILKIKKSGRK